MEPLVFKKLSVDQDNKLCSINGEVIALSKKEWYMNISLK